MGVIHSTRPVGGSVPHDVRVAIEHRCPVKVFDPGNTLMRHGETSRTCFLIISGTVLVTTQSTQGATMVLSRRGPGHLVGELAALEGAPRSATVTATTRVTTRCVSTSELHALLHEHPDWAIALLCELSAQLRSLTERYALRSEDLRRRLGDVLVANLDETDDSAFRSSRDELAAWVGATREATTRMLRTLEAEGLVELGRGFVRVVDRDGLLS